MVRDVSAEEIKEKILSLYDGKAAGPDGYGTMPYFEGFLSHFRRRSQCRNSIFFQSSFLLKEINSTVIALIPKVKNPTVAYFVRLYTSVLLRFSLVG